MFWCGNWAYVAGATEEHNSAVAGIERRSDSPLGGDATKAGPLEAELRLVRGAENSSQARDCPRSLSVMQAWQAEALRRAVGMNRDGDGVLHRLDQQVELEQQEHQRE